MSRSIKLLTARQVATVKAYGRHADGGGLYLHIAVDGARWWTFMPATEGTPGEIALGDALTISLAKARRMAGEMRDAVAAGQDPQTVIIPTMSDEQNTIPTFGAFARSYIISIERNWKNPKDQQDFQNSLRNHAKLLLGRPIDQIGTDEVIAVLEPIWLRSPRTAKRLRARIEKILDAANARGFRSKDAVNPAAWHGHLARLLPAPVTQAHVHYPALPWNKAPTFMAELRSRQALAARCLEFLILTAARRAEALGLMWGEIDFKIGLWTIPMGRMSGGASHEVPLSSYTVALLKALRPDPWLPDMRVFAVEGTPLSDRAISMLLRRMKRESITTHGFRTTFKDWARDANYPSELVEKALAHSVSTEAEGAYGRATECVRRRELMEAWSEFLNSQSK